MKLGIISLMIMDTLTETIGNMLSNAMTTRDVVNNTGALDQLHSGMKLALQKKHAVRILTQEP